MKSEKAHIRPVLTAIQPALPGLDVRSKYTKLQAVLHRCKEKISSLEKSVQENETLYEHGPCGNFTLDDKGSFKKINDTLLSWLGHTRAGFSTKRKFSSLLTEESRGQFKQIYPAFTESGSFTNAIFNLIKKDGSPLRTLVSARACYNRSGAYSGGYFAVFNISSNDDPKQALEKSYEDLKLQNETLAADNKRLLSLNREKDRFMDIATHDLQLPLSAISMLSEILVNEEIASGSPAEKRLFGMIHEAALEMRSLVVNYMSAGLSETGTMKPFISLIDLTQLAEVLVKRYTPAAVKKNIRIYFENTKPILLNTDRECCVQVIDNLLSNAIKYTEPGKAVALALNRSGNSVQIMVTDEGPGIAKEEQPLLFQRFQKLSARPTGGESSTGLGLSIVKYLVEQLKGRITVQSEMGSGSIFTVRLPV